MERNELRGTLEALLFAADRALSLEEVSEVLGGESLPRLREVLEELLIEYSHPDRGLKILKVAGGYRIGTRPEYGESIRALFRHRNRFRLSPAALETLALVAYRQPVTAVEIQQIRGACSQSVIHTLLERKLIRIAGRKQVVGRPILYATGPEFLAHFGLNTLEELPRLREIPEGGDLDSEKATQGDGSGPAFP